MAMIIVWDLLQDFRNYHMNHSKNYPIYIVEAVSSFWIYLQKI